MTSLIETLAPTVTSALAGIDVESDGLEATVYGEPVSAESPHELARKLGSLLYEMVHVGRDKPTATRPRTLRDTAFDERLAAALPHTTTLTNVQVLGKADEQTYLVSINGLRVLLPVEALVSAVSGDLPQTAAVRMPAARPALSPGFFLVDGTPGMGAGPQTLRLYVHLATPDAAPAVWHTLLSYLESRDLPYRAKIGSAPKTYPRRDALVLYLRAQVWPAVPDIASAVAGMDGVGEGTSPFAHAIAPGVGLAWEPSDRRPGMNALSFGEHRSVAMAEGLVKHAVRTDGVSLPETVAESFMDANIDPLAPACNLDSPIIAAMG